MRESCSFLRTCALIAFPLMAGIASMTQPIAAAPADATVTPGEFVVEHPTLINLGFEWHIDGDANRNASVDVSFRKQGETRLATGDAAGAAARRAGLPAQRVQSRDAEHVCRQHPGSRAGHRLRGALRDDGSRRRQRTRGERDQDRDRADASRADAGRRAARPITSTRRSGRGRRSSRPSKGSCAPTTTTAAPATPRRADVRA